jgi:hypothetical protein
MRAICTDEVLGMHNFLLTVRIHGYYHWEFRIRLLVNAYIDQSRIAQDTSLRVPQQIIFHDPLNTALVDGSFVAESRGRKNLWYDCCSLDDFVLVFRGIPECELPHVTSLILDLVRDAERLEYFQCSGLDAIRLAGFKSTGLGIDAKEGGVAEAIAR